MANIQGGRSWSEFSKAVPAQSNSMSGIARWGVGQDTDGDEGAGDDTTANDMFEGVSAVKKTKPAVKKGKPGAKEVEGSQDELDERATAGKGMTDKQYAKYDKKEDAQSKDKDEV